jgi:Transglutaminase-like superfamily
MSKCSTILWMLLTFLLLLSASAVSETEEHYYAIEQNGVIFGYAHVIVTQTAFAGRAAVQLIDSIWMQVSALGKPFEGKYRFEYYIDPADGMYFYHASAIDQGGTRIGGTMTVRGDSVYIVSDPGGDTSTVTLLSGTIMHSTKIYKHLIDFFVTDTLTQKVCPVFSEVDGKINTVTYTNRGRQRLALAGKTYDALMVDVLDRTTGIQSKLWIDAATGLLLKMIHPARNINLTDAAIKDRIGRADLDEEIFARVNKVITDPLAISYMKVQAKLQPGGLWITSASLNVPGQKFEGTVENNQIEGIFEISHKRYNGLNAPPFPCNFYAIDSIRQHLEPGNMIESDDSTIVRKAREITADAKDSWEAAIRLSRWVSEEIVGDIPGGGTALQTYKTKRGDCGSHSFLLAAFCRAVGIPNRIVFGCIYVPDHGGGFGQHGWNEIYMGSAGWIPVDATVKEIDYADCSHIRLGEVTSKAAMFNPEKMEILDYRLAADSADAGDEAGAKTQYDPFVGKYKGDKGELSIVIQNGSLGLDIPGRNMVFELKNPDEEGNWFFKLSNAASISFTRDLSDAVTSITICERQKLPRRPENDSITAQSAIPEMYRPIVGSYIVPMQNATVEIVFKEDRLMLCLPGGRTIALTRSESDNQWLAEKSQSTKLVLSFEINEEGQVIFMRMNSFSQCSKITEAASPNQTEKK